MMDLLTQLRHFILKHELLPRGASVVIGVSGGPDSLCLLHALHTLAPELDLRLHVAHLDHQLRGAASEADAHFVGELAQHWGLPHTIDSRDVHGFARSHKLSLEEAARQVRYGFLLEVALAQGSQLIAVAHHADDQTETVLMHFLRGSGLAGLRGMLPKSPISNLQFPTLNLQPPISHSEMRDRRSKIYLVRPLLDTPRSEIETYCEQHGLAPRRDATNADTTYFRNRLRHELLPALETYNPNIRTVLRHTAAVIAADYDTLSAHTNFAWDMTILTESHSAITFDLALWREQPIGTQRALLRRAIHQLRPPLRDVDFIHIEAALELVQRAHTGDQATLPQNLLLEVSYNRLIIAPREELSLPDWPLLPERFSSLAVSVPGVTPLPESAWILEASSVLPSTEYSSGLAAQFDAAALPTSLRLRPRQTTDRFHPQGMPAPVRLKDWMISVKVPRAIRDRLPLIVTGEHIIWVPGFRVGQPFLVSEKTRQIVKLIFRKIPR